ncbi:Hypothetical protein, putative [Bodo saltans]|uniref:Uncharacterized protein n=1 Tax=Bodo saltans TaxID=75058 RepID=A0A0S4J3P9_BODSA|nr:Hypothetical protein, putative [Bodo saltans]|eukprot:CUG85841.1 Hypothetical protein, putative [Bodo saltans]
MLTPYPCYTHQNTKLFYFELNGTMLFADRGSLKLDIFFCFACKHVIKRGEDMAPRAERESNLQQPHEEQLSSQFWVFLFVGVLISSASYFILHAEDDKLPPVVRHGRDSALEFLGFSLNAGRKAFRSEEARLSRTCSLTLSVDSTHVKKQPQQQNANNNEQEGKLSSRIDHGDLLKFTDFAVYDASTLASLVDTEPAIEALQDLDIQSLPLLHQATKPIIRTQLPTREYTFTAGGAELLPCLTTALASGVASSKRSATRKVDSDDVNSEIEVGSIVTVYCCASSAFGPLGFSAWGVAPNRDVIIQFGPISRG